MLIDSLVTRSNNNNGGLKIIDSFLDWLRETRPSIMCVWYVDRGPLCRIFPVYLISGGKSFVFTQ